MRQLKIKPSSSRAFDVSVESSRGVIEVKGTGKLFIPANLYVLKIEIEKRFDTNEEAYSTSKDCIKVINDILKQAGLNSTDIKVISKYPVKRLEKIGYDSKGMARYDFYEFNFPKEKKLVVAMVHLYSYGLSEEERMVVTDINSVETAKSSVREFKGSIRQKLGEAFKTRAVDAVKLREELDDISKNIPLIVCGDFNDVPASWTYNIIRGDDLRDAYSETNFGPAITYNLHAFYFHIDQMLYRGPLRALDLSVGDINSSDHYPLLAEFEFLPSKN